MMTIDVKMHEYLVTKGLRSLWELSEYSSSVERLDQHNLFAFQVPSGQLRQRWVAA